jgi:hypothetical protein
MLIAHSGIVTNGSKVNLITPCGLGALQFNVMLLTKSLGI